MSWEILLRQHFSNFPSPVRPEIKTQYYVTFLNRCQRLIKFINDNNRLTGLYSLSIGVVLLFVLGIREGAVARTSTAAAVMRRPAVAVEPHTTVARLVDDVLSEHRQTAFFVTAGGRLHGVVTLDALRSVPRDAWPRTAVSAFMHPVDESHFVVSTAPAAEARRKVETNGVGYVAVLDGDGMVVGSVHPEDLKPRR